MTLTLYDSLTREKRAFVPADEKRVTMYVCGPTVYNHAHIGNFRAAIVFDLLFRLLRRRFGEAHVIYARNFTDIDDKIIKASRETGRPIAEITAKYAAIYDAELDTFNALAPTLKPTATGHIAEMTAMIDHLVRGGFAYEAQAHVLFRTAAFPAYGRLSGVCLDDMLAGARVDVAPYKENAADFVLWKPSRDDEPGWESPWGRGRPGWHIECSAMIDKAFGSSVDIHGGGQDLKFPHHENEIAQSACAHGGAPLARFWLHNGFLNMGADKMSKSLGNVALPRDLLMKHHGETLRFALLSAHYRQPLEWSDALIEQSKKQLDRFYRLLAEAPAGAAAPGKTLDAEAPESIILALEDDMNTPEAIAGLHELRDIAMQLEGAPRARAAARLKSAGALMGLLQHDPIAWSRWSAPVGNASLTAIYEQFAVVVTTTALTEEKIDEMISERAAARLAKDFKTSDRIRDALAAQGVFIEDGPAGTTWRRG